MEWKNIQSLLGKAAALLNGQDVVKDAVISLIQKKFSVAVSRDRLRIKGGVVLVDGHPALKNEIQIRKKDLLASLHADGVRVVDIR